MNKARRKKLSMVVSLLMCLEDLDDKDVMGKLRETAKWLKDVYEDEQIALDSFPDSLQFSTRADAFNDNINNLLDAMIDFDLVIDGYKKSGDFNDVKAEISSVIQNCTEAIER